MQFQKKNPKQAKIEQQKRAYFANKEREMTALKAFYANIQVIREKARTFVMPQTQIPLSHPPLQEDDSQHPNNIFYNTPTTLKMHYPDVADAPTPLQEDDPQHPNNLFYNSTALKMNYPTVIEEVPLTTQKYEPIAFAFYETPPLAGLLKNAKEPPLKFPPILETIVTPQLTQIPDIPPDVIDTKAILKQFQHFIQSNKITHIINVYQETYANGKSATGFGDYLRGCYFVMQFCDYIQPVGALQGGALQGGALILHTVANFLASHHAPLQRASDVNFYENPNWITSTYTATGDIIDTLNSQTQLIAFMQHILYDSIIVDCKVYVYTISFPLWPEKLTQHHRQKMRELLSPRAYLFPQNPAIPPYTYQVIHVRAGDAYLIEGNTTFSPSYKIALIQHITELLCNTANTTFVLIADNNAIKKLIQLHLTRQQVSRIYMLDGGTKPLSHFGEGTVQSRSKIKNTMTDFYVMSQATKIHAFTSYIHGTGFSRWCAETYGIPYYCYYLPAS